jgi:F0F1-type ATP synthase delta subunit
MQQKISRRKLAMYIADSLEKGASLSALLRELAAYLVLTKRTREAELVVRAVEDTLAERGSVIARVTTAHPLDATLRREIEQLVDAKTVHLYEIVDPEVIGGVRIETPGAFLDATLKRKLLALRQAKL